jgi:hypothetical protein
MMESLSPCDAFSLSSSGFIALQGPHHPAKKSTSVGVEL